MKTLLLLAGLSALCYGQSVAVVRFTGAPGTIPATINITPGTGCTPGGTSGQVLVSDGAGDCNATSVTISGTNITGNLVGNADTASAVAVGGITGLGTGVATWLATPSGANLAAALTTAIPLSKGGTNQTSWTASRCVQVNSGGTALEPAAAGCGTGGSSAFSDLTSGTNTTAAMVVGTGASISATGSGTITATAVPVGGISGLGSGVGTWLATPSGANLASALTTSLPNTKGGTGGDSSAATGIAHVAAGTWSYSTIVNADVSASAAIALSKLATQAADTLVMNATGSSAVPTAVALPTSGTNGCAGSSNALTYNTSTHALGCNTISGGGASSSQQLTDVKATKDSGTQVTVASGVYATGNVTYSSSGSVVTLVQLVMTACTAANPMVCTVSAVPSSIQIGDQLSINSAAGTGCSGMNNIFTVLAKTGTTLSLNYNNTGCTYTSSSGSIGKNSSATGNVLIYGNNNGEIVISPPSSAGLIITCTNSCVVSQATTPTVYGMQIASISLSGTGGGNWDTVTDTRAAFNTNLELGGTGITVTPTGGQNVIAVDATVAIKDASNTWAGTNDYTNGGLIPPGNNTVPGSCTNGMLFVDRDATSTAQLNLCVGGTYVTQGGGSSQTCWFDLQLASGGVAMSSYPGGNWIASSSEITSYYSGYAATFMAPYVFKNTAATSDVLFRKIFVPRCGIAGASGVTVNITASSATSGNLKLGLATACNAQGVNGETPSYSSPSYTTNAMSGTQSTSVVFTWTLDLSSCPAGNALFMRFNRDNSVGGNVADWISVNSGEMYK